MIRQWTAENLRNLRSKRSRSNRAPVRGIRPGFENLEYRLAMSSCALGGVVDLNLIVVNADGREVTVAPYQRHATTLKRLQPDWIQARPANTQLGPARTALKPNTQGDCS